MNFKIVTAAIVLQDNKVLLTRKAPGQSLEGYWEFPGGKVEEGESLQECLKREIFEELGVQAEVEQDEFCVVKHQYDHGEILLVGIRGCTKFCLNGLIMGENPLQRRDYDRRSKTSCTKRINR